MFPAPVGSAVKYIRALPKLIIIDAILLGYDLLPADASEDAVPTAHLAVAHPDSQHKFRDANWADAFEKIDLVPYEPKGEFYHGWTLSDSAAEAARLQKQIDQLDVACDQGSDALFQKDAEIQKLQAELASLNAANLQLADRVGEAGKRVAELEAQLNQAPQPAPAQPPTQAEEAAQGQPGQVAWQRRLPEGGQAISEDQSAQ